MNRIKDWAFWSVVWLSLGLAASAAEKRDWRIFKTANFEMLTDGSDRQAEVALERLERYRAAAIRMQGERIISRLPVRVYLLLSDDEFSWMRSTGKLGKGTVGIYQPTQDENLLAVSTVDDKETEGRVLLHEYNHLLLRGYLLDWPLWLREGFALILETVELRGDRAVFGKPVPFFGAYLQRRGLMPMTELFEFERSAKTRDDQELIALVYAQSWAVCHYLYFGLMADRQREVLDFIHQVAGGKPVEEALMATLKLTPEELQKAVEQHLRAGRSQTAGYLLPPEMKDLPKPARRSAEAGEAEAWLGDWAFAGGKLDKAEQRYRTSLARSPGNAAGSAGLGRVLAEQDKYPEAVDLLRQASEKDPQSGWVWYQYGSVLLDSVRHSLPEGTNRAEVPAACWDALNRAIELLPKHPGPVRELARAKALQGAKLQEIVDTYGRAAALDPADLLLPLEVAILLAHRGQRQVALTYLDSVNSRTFSGTIAGGVRVFRKAIQNSSTPEELDQELAKLSEE